MKDHEKDQRIAALEFELEKYKQAFQQANLDYFDINLETGQAFQSEVIVKMMGYEAEDLNTFEKRNATFHPEDLAQSLKVVDQMVNNEIDKTDLLFRLYGKDGSQYWIKHDGTMVVNPITGERHFVGMLRDITQEKGNLDSLKRLANLDSLTNTLNRRSGFAKLQADIDAGADIKVVYIDLNDFKAVNDIYGHETGDHLLQTFSDLVRGLLPKASYLIRLGGDEFLMVTIGLSLDHIQSLIEAISQHKIMYGDGKYLTYSYGLTIYDPKKHGHIETLIHDSDQAMYAYKRRMK